MKVRATLATIALFAAASGCGARQPAPAAPSQNHPASPQAAETPAPGASATLNPGPAPDADGAAPGTAPQAGSDALASPAAYTCAHHPKVMEAEPGECPYCGMKLEPTTSRQTSPLRQRDDLPDAGTEPAGETEEPEHAEHGSDDAPAAHEHGEHE